MLLAFGFRGLCKQREFQTEDISLGADLPGSAADWQLHHLQQIELFLINPR